MQLSAQALDGIAYGGCPEGLQPSVVMLAKRDGRVVPTWFDFDLAMTPGGASCTMTIKDIVWVDDTRKGEEQVVREPCDAQFELPVPSFGWGAASEGEYLAGLQELIDDYDEDGMAGLLHAIVPAELLPAYRAVMDGSVSLGRQAGQAA